MRSVFRTSGSGREHSGDFIATSPSACYNTRMNKPLKITKIGNSAGIVLPKEVLAHLDRKVGDELTLVLKPNGIELVGGEPDFEEQMAAARKVMAARKRALRELAK